MNITVFTKFSSNKIKGYGRHCNSINECLKAYNEFKLKIKEYPELKEIQVIGAVIWDKKIPGKVPFVN